MELFQASHQWSSRPADERAANLVELHRMALESRHMSAGASIPSKHLRVEAVNGDVQLIGRTGHPAQLTHWAFGQLAATAKAPASYLRKLPPTLAAQNINHGLSNHAREEQRLLIHRNGSYLVRAVTSEQYTRVWNSDLTQRLLQLPDYWKTPPAMGNQPSGLYISPEDLFVFLVDDDHRVNDGSDEGMGRGFFLINSEVGKRCLELVTFLYRYVCGNHIVWGAKHVKSIKLRHVGNIESKFNRVYPKFIAQVKEYANAAASEDDARIKAAQTKVIAFDKEAVLDELFKRQVAPRKTLQAAYESTVHQPEDGNPNSYWGMAQGLTRVSQGYANADTRTALDTAAGRVLEMVPF